MEDKKILENLKGPYVLKELNQDELKILCSEIREKIIQTVSKNGGHLASNLGVVELTVALHRVFDTPNDSIVWDVGHQCYTHKILTGRLKQMDGIRTKGGIAGFPKRSESCYDSFNAGHSSTSISAAYGIAAAKSILNDDSRTIAVIGDGALTGGMAYEGLNNAGRFKKNFIIVLNDNEMSISRNVGGIARYLMGIRIKPSYIKTKSRVERMLLKTPLIGKPIRNFLFHSKSKVKKMVYRRDTLFEYLGMDYYGPIDGHDLTQLENAFNAAKRIKRPVLVHVMTKKGKGYKFAENKPGAYHGISSFNIRSGETKKSGRGFSDVFGDKLCKMAQNDKKICAITAAMALGTGLSGFAEKYKDRLFDVGIAEEHAVTFACGMATMDILPVFAVYSTFLQRCYDQIIHDAALQKLHLILAIDRAGIVGEDGETHQGIFDAAFLNTIPNVTVYSPAYFKELELCMENAAYNTKGVVAIRYPRGGEGYKLNNYNCTGNPFDFYGNDDDQVLIVTYGRIFSEASMAKVLLDEKGISTSILKLNRIKPIDGAAVELAMKYKKIYFYEEGILNGGIAQTFENMLVEAGFKDDYYITAINDDFVQQSAVKSALAELKLDCDSIIQRIEKDRGSINGEETT